MDSGKLSVKFMSIDNIGFAQMVLFGFPFGERTLIEGESFSDILPNHLSYLLSPIGHKAEEKNPILSSILKQSISEELYGLNSPAIFMSAGYDSRLILAGMLASGARPSLVTYHNRSTPSELNIVSEISKCCNLPFIPCIDRGISRDTFEERLSNYSKSSFFLSNPVRLMYFGQALDAGIQTDGIFSGEGETFRFPGFPSEYLTRNALAILFGKDVSMPRNNIFTGLPWDEAIQEVKSGLNSWNRELGEMGLIHKWLIEQAYPKIYGSMAMAFGFISSVHLPLLRPRLLRDIALSDYSLSKRKRMQSNIWELWRSKKIYADMIEDLYPDLLHIQTDRGYNPNRDKNILQYLYSNCKSRVRRAERKAFSASIGALSYKRILCEKLREENVKLPFTNRDEILNRIKHPEGLSGDSIHSLSQVLTLSEMNRTGHI